MGKVAVRQRVALSPADALRLWTDVSRWPTFVDGFARALRLDREWPQPGSQLVWESVPRGRGRVTERVEAYDPGGRFATRVFEEQLSGAQTVEVARMEDEEGGTMTVLGLEYELQRFQGILGRLADVLFIRRALRDSLRRTLRRFAIEAREDATLLLSREDATPGGPRAGMPEAGQGDAGEERRWT